jgi:2-polyprenyl-3-methyl-5-hydroxy-6-metoxy-1,4-benzoquinol methylase
MAREQVRCPVCRSDNNRIQGFFIDGRYLYRCDSCGTEFQHPQLDDAELEKLYSQDYYRSWGLHEGNGDSEVQKVKSSTFDACLDRIQEYKKNGRILDIGCATGYFLERAQHRGFIPYGVEFSQFSSDIAKGKFGADQIHRGMIEDCPFEPGSFDVVVMIDLLEHVRNPVAALAAAKKLLRDDGIAVIVTPDTRSLTHALMGTKWVHYKSEHFFYFNKRAIDVVARQSGFELCRYEASKKALNVRYIYHQFAVYRHFLLTPLSSVFHALLPAGIRGKTFFVTMGEMAVVLKKAP